MEFITTGPDGRIYHVIRNEWIHIAGSTGEVREVIQRYHQRISNLPFIVCEELFNILAEMILNPKLFPPETIRFGDDEVTDVYRMFLVLYMFEFHGLSLLELMTIKIPKGIKYRIRPKVRKIKRGPNGFVTDLMSSLDEIPLVKIENRELDELFLACRYDVHRFSKSIFDHLTMPVIIGDSDHLDVLRKYCHHLRFPSFFVSGLSFFILFHTGLFTDLSYLVQMFRIRSLDHVFDSMQI